MNSLLRMMCPMIGELEEQLETIAALKARLSVQAELIEECKALNNYL